ncbi:MAG: hypothetical protein QOF56_2060, partial [Acidobacteriaceae bacterium]|nr:hypothetical protein [Acidobacteriaceae bacterium]
MSYFSAQAKQEPPFLGLRGAELLRSRNDLEVYAPKSHKTEYSRAAERAIRWLERAEPASTEDQVFQILGLICGGGSPETIR